MTDARSTRSQTPQSYLADEVRSPARREYVGGFTYAMAGATNAHNQIATNVLVAVGGRLRGSPCRPFNSDTKVRIRLPFELRFYYPDAMVTCRPNPPGDTFQDEPRLLVEVLSAESRRIDEGEKLLAYLTIPSLAAYLLVEQEFAEVGVMRRSGQEFARELARGRDAVVALPELGIDLPLAEVYEGVGFGEV
jgi:Uma2 family endonuclease